MRSRTWATVTAAVILAVLGAASDAQAQIVSFRSIRDAVPGKFFDAATTARDPANLNRLLIGFNTGFNLTTFIANDFRASALPFSNRSAMDTISFTVKAPIGFYIARITYTERGTGFTGRTDISAGGATWVVAGHPFSLGVFSNNPNLSRTVDLTGSRPTSVPVSITVSLFASTGSVAVTSADVVVTVLPLVQ
ncbi:MAG: hypothetical protein DMF84_22030 [Acidobacteria bacterium]|nr:MAG: hypothetical protein DMF84_22030 [Acidobacteriota bacterium]